MLRWVIDVARPLSVHPLHPFTPSPRMPILRFPARSGNRPLSTHLLNQVSNPGWAQYTKLRWRERHCAASPGSTQCPGVAMLRLRTRTLVVVVVARTRSHVSVRGSRAHRPKAGTERVLYEASAAVTRTHAVA